MYRVLATMYPPEAGFSLHRVLSMMINQLLSITNNIQKNFHQGKYLTFTESGDFYLITKAFFCISETFGLEFQL